MIKRITMFALALTLISTGCSHLKQQPKVIEPGVKSPVRLVIHEGMLSNELTEILLLPPIGVENKIQSDQFNAAISAAMRKHLVTPIRMIQPEGAYAPYLREKNLIHSDGTINATEAAIIGELMGCDYIICPYVTVLRPYPPQRISLRFLIVCTQTRRMCAELSGEFNADDPDTYDYFVDYNIASGYNGDLDDLRFKIKSPAAFQAFTADACSSVIAKRFEKRVEDEVKKSR